MSVGLWLILLAFPRFRPDPLQDAILKNDAAKVRSVINSGADINRGYGKPWDPWQAIHIAVASGSEDVLRELVRGGADLNAVTPTSGYTPLVIACLSENASEACIDFLCESGADINAADSAGVTALHRVAQHHYSERVRTLIRNGADVNVTASDGNTPLHSACDGIWTDFGRPETTIQLLLEAGADPSIRNRNGLTARELLQRYDRGAFWPGEVPQLDSE